MNAKADDIAHLLQPYVCAAVGSAGGGKHSFRLLCSVPKCYRQDTVSASRRTIGSEIHRMKACEKFAGQGWTIKNGPVCPDCRKAGSAEFGR